MFVGEKHAFIGDLYNPVYITLYFISITIANTKEKVN